MQLHLLTGAVTLANWGSYAKQTALQKLRKLQKNGQKRQKNVG